MAAPDSREAPPDGPPEASPAALIERAKQRDWWDRAEIIGKILTGLLPAILVAAIGLFGQQFTQSLENNRLYTELLTRREQADTELRKDMFTVLMSEFLAGTASVPGAVAKAAEAEAGRRADAPAQLRAEIAAFTDQLLKIELLALNFSESLTLSPLFQRLDSNLFNIEARIDAQVAGSRRLTLKALVIALRKRLVGLATRVSSSQIAALKAVGDTFTITVPVSAAAKGYLWPFDDPSFAPGNLPQESELRPGDVACGRVVRQFHIQFSEPDLERKRVRVSLTVLKIAELGDDGPVLAASLDANTQTVEKRFSLDFFNFPLVDSTRLSDDQRFSLVMTEFDENVIVATALCFSGTHSSVRDRPFVNDIIETLSR